MKIIALNEPSGGKLLAEWSALAHREVSIIEEAEHMRTLWIMDQQDIALSHVTITKHGEWATDPDVVAADKAILNGERMGDAFRKEGFDIRENILDVYTISLSPWMRREFRTIEGFAKARNLEFVIRKQDRIYNYGLVTEIYSPDFIKPAVTDKDRELINFSFATLKASGFSEREIWNLAGNEYMPYSPICFNESSTNC